MATRRVISYVMCLAVAGCAVPPRPESIKAIYVDPSTYQNYSCAQLFGEKQRLVSEVVRVSGLQRENADTADSLVYLAVFAWPVMIGGAFIEDRAEELGRLNGEYKAVDQQIKMKQCDPPAPTTPGSTQEAAAPAAGESEQSEAQPSVRWSGAGSRDGCDKPFTIDVLVQEKNVKGQLDRGGIVYSINGKLNLSGNLEDSLAPLKNAAPSNEIAKYVNIKLDFGEQTATGGFSTFDGHRLDCATAVTLQRTEESG